MEGEPTTDRFEIPAGEGKAPLAEEDQRRLPDNPPLPGVTAIAASVELATWFDRHEYAFAD
jgi:hypothetical protein